MIRITVHHPHLNILEENSEISINGAENSPLTGNIDNMGSFIILTVKISCLEAASCNINCGGDSCIITETIGAIQLGSTLNVKIDEEIIM